MFILPTLNYASAACDPYLTRVVDQLEKVQRRGARWVKNNYHDRSPGCVTNMLTDLFLTDLQWLPLKEQRRAHRLRYLHKIKPRSWHRPMQYHPAWWLVNKRSGTKKDSKVSSLQCTTIHSILEPPGIGTNSRPASQTLMIQKESKLP